MDIFHHMTAKDRKSYNLAVTDGPSDGQYELGAADLVLDILSTHDARQVSVAALCRGMAPRKHLLLTNATFANLFFASFCYTFYS